MEMESTIEDIRGPKVEAMFRDARCLCCGNLLFETRQQGGIISWLETNAGDWVEVQAICFDCAESMAQTIANNLKKLRSRT